MGNKGGPEKANDGVEVNPIVATREQCASLNDELGFSVAPVQTFYGDGRGRNERGPTVGPDRDERTKELIDSAQIVRGSASKVPYLPRWRSQKFYKKMTDIAGDIVKLWDDGKILSNFPNLCNRDDAIVMKNVLARMARMDKPSHEEFKTIIRQEAGGDFDKFAYGTSGVFNLCLAAMRAKDVVHNFGNLKKVQLVSGQFRLGAVITGETGAAGLEEVSDLEEVADLREVDALDAEEAKLKLEQEGQKVKDLERKAEDLEREADGIFTYEAAVEIVEEALDSFDGKYDVLIGANGADGRVSRSPYQILVPRFDKEGRNKSTYKEVRLMERGTGVGPGQFKIVESFDISDPKFVDNLRAKLDDLLPGKKSDSSDAVFSSPEVAKSRSGALKVAHEMAELAIQGNAIKGKFVVRDVENGVAVFDKEKDIRVLLIKVGEPDSSGKLALTFVPIEGQKREFVFDETVDESERLKLSMDMGEVAANTVVSYKNKDSRQVDHDLKVADGLVDHARVVEEALGGHAEIVSRSKLDDFAKELERDIADFGVMDHGVKPVIDGDSLQLIDKDGAYLLPGKPLVSVRLVGDKIKVGRNKTFDTFEAALKEAARLVSWQISRPAIVERHAKYLRLNERNS